MDKWNYKIDTATVVVGLLILMLMRGGWHIGAAQHYKSDSGIGAQLDSLDMAFGIDDDGDYYVPIRFCDDPKSHPPQVAWVLTDLANWRGVEMRYVISIGYEATDELPDDVRKTMATFNAQQDAGEWVEKGGKAIFVVPIPPNAEKSILHDAIMYATRVGRDLAALHDSEAFDQHTQPSAQI